MLVAVLLGMRASDYFIFWNFHKHIIIIIIIIIHHDLYHAILGKCIYFFHFVHVIWVCKYARI